MHELNNFHPGLDTRSLPRRTSRTTAYIQTRTTTRTTNLAALTLTHPASKWHHSGSRSESQTSASRAPSQETQYGRAEDGAAAASGRAAG